ncbi:MAG: hypothetical protein QM750_03900 [Rubrivivax sp.]
MGTWTPERDTGQVALTMGLALLFGVGAVFVCLWDQGTIWRGLLWAGAWSAIGWFLGFLFGIPRFLSSDTARTPGASALERARQEAATAAAAAKERRGEADAVAADKVIAEKAATDQAQAASDAADAAARATALAAASPQDQALKDAADAAAQAVSRAKQQSDEAAAAAKAAADKALAADAAAGEADRAAEVAKRKEVAAGTGADVAPRASLTVNTNLEQISDWLTKIIVGVSLVESQALLDQMQRAATFMAKSFAMGDAVAAWMNSRAAVAAAAAAAKAAASAADAASAPLSCASCVPALEPAQAASLASFASMQSVAYAVILYFLATSLLGSYLLTRLFLQRALDDAAVRSGAAS